MAKNSIAVETTTVSAISAAAAIPGGVAMAFSIPGDLVQYYAGVLRIMQKLAYLYGFDEIDFDENSVDDGALTEVLLFLGIMSGVEGANAAVAKLAESIAVKTAKDLPKKALTKTAWYPIIQKVAKAVGIKLTKQVFCDGFAKIVPVVGSVISGGITLASFAPSASRLKNYFGGLELCDPEFYRAAEAEVESVEDA